MKRSARLIFFVLLALIIPALPSAHAAERSALRVATRLVPPLVQKDNGKLTGFSVELWNAVADRLGAKTEFVEMPDVPSLLDSVRNGKVDLGIAAISITADRDKIFDFSQPMLSAGLQILVRGKSIRALQILSKASCACCFRR